MDFESRSDYEDLVERSLKEILRHEDFARFLSWMSKELKDSSHLSLHPTPGDHLSPLATSLALSIWNGTPLPGNDFQTKPIPIPNRNQPCVCGSGKKYKKCCSMGTDQLLHIEEDMIWPLLIQALPKKVFQRGIKDDTLPIKARILYCAEALDGGKSDKVIKLLLGYYLVDSYKDAGEHAAFGLTLLFDAFDQQGAQEKKLNLIDHICATAPPSLLRSEALQRLSTIQADAGDLPEAFKTLKKARKDTPNNLDIGLLEVQLLLVKGDLSLAQQRARFISTQIRRQDTELPNEQYENPMLKFLEQVIEDPEQAALMMSGMDATNDSALAGWIQEACKQPITPYLFEKDEALSNMLDDYSATDRPHFTAHPPSSIQSLGDSWGTVCPIEPLFGVNFTPFGDDGPWDDTEHSEWQHFLFEHPESADSITIIDDLFTILFLHPDWGMDEVMITLFEPLLHRAMAIVEKSLSSLPEDGCLPWMVTDNRPLLRTLIRAIIHATFTADPSSVKRISQQVLHLNPADNHGLRRGIINQYLHDDHNEEALHLADNFPSDMMPEILYGRVLALYRLNRKEEALTAAREAKRQCPKVASYLIAPQRKEPPQSSPYGTVAGGRQEAWEYRIEMRETWKTCRGILTWLKKA